MPPESGCRLLSRSRIEEPNQGLVRCSCCISPFCAICDGFFLLIVVCAFARFKRFALSPADHLGICGLAEPRFYSFGMEGMPWSYGGQPSLGFAVSVGIRVPRRDGSRQVSSTMHLLNEVDGHGTHSVNTFCVGWSWVTLTVISLTQIFSIYLDERPHP